MPENLADAFNGTLIERERFTYAASAANHDGLKIGATHEPGSRLKTLSGKPYGVCKNNGCARLEAVHYERVYQAGFALESFLRFYFRDRVIHGEWHDVKPDELDSVIDKYEPIHAALKDLEVGHLVTFDAARAINTAKKTPPEGQNGT